jgi:hypothetical protein
MNPKKPVPKVKSRSKVKLSSSQVNMLTRKGLSDDAAIVLDLLDTPGLFPNECIRFEVYNNMRVDEKRLVRAGYTAHIDALRRMTKVAKLSVWPSFFDPQKRQSLKTRTSREFQAVSGAYEQKVAAAKAADKPARATCKSPRYTPFEIGTLQFLIQQDLNIKSAYLLFKDICKDTEHLLSGFEVKWRAFQRLTMDERKQLWPGFDDQETVEEIRKAYATSKALVGCTGTRPNEQLILCGERCNECPNRKCVGRPCTRCTGKGRNCHVRITPDIKLIYYQPGQRPDTVTGEPDCCYDCDV